MPVPKFYFALIKDQYKKTQYSTLNVKLSNWQFDKLEPGIKNGTEVTWKSFPNVADDFDDENGFRHKLLITKAQFSKLPKPFANNCPANKIL